MGSTAPVLPIKRGNRLVVELACGGDDVLDAPLPHRLRVRRHPGPRVPVRFLAPLDGNALSRRQISDHCYRAIAKTPGFGTSGTRPLPTAPVVARVFVSLPASLDEAA